MRVGTFMGTRLDMLMEWSHLEEVGILGGLLSPRCWRGWGFSGSRPGVGKGRGWRGRDHLK